MPKQGKNIYLRKDGRWEGRYPKSRLNGKIQYGYVFGITYEDVESRLNEVLCSFTSAESDAATFKSISSEWLLNLKPQINASSVTKYTSILNSYLNPHFGDDSICAIARGDVMLYSRELLTSG